LESKGWSVEHVWSRNWWKDFNKEIERLSQKIEELRKIKTSADLSTPLTKMTDTQEVPNTSIIHQEHILDCTSELLPD
jgi:hypothetical protein